MRRLKVLCVADHIDPLVYSNAIRERFREIDFIVSAGDLPLSYHDYLVSMLNKPLYFVFGNHNLRALRRFERFAEDDLELRAPDFYQPGAGTYVSSKVVRGRGRAEGVLIAGLGGCMWYNGGPNQFKDRRMFLRALRLVPRLWFNRLVHGRYLDILLTHAPPRGIQDGTDLPHRGFKAFAWIVRRFRPQYVIHGHVHLYSLNDKRATVVGQTTVVNAYDHTVVDVEVP